MRTRSRIVEQVTNAVHNGQLVVTVDGEAPVGPSTYAPTPWPVDNVLETETIVDEVGNLRTTKFVSHTKQRFTRNNIASEDYRVGNTLYQSTSQNAHWWTHGQYGGNLSFGHIPTHYPQTEEQLIKQAVRMFYDNNMVDSLLNIVEAPQLVTGLKSFGEHINTPTKKGYLTWKERKRHLRNNALLLSGGYLYYAFGIAPLLSDMRKLSDSVTKFSASLKRAAKKGGTEIAVRARQQGYFSGISADGNGQLPDGYGLNGALDGSKWHTTLYGTTMPTMIATVRGNREHRYQTETFQKLDYLASRFGSTGPASFAWEKVPFSFVVDWFLDITDVLVSVDNALTGSSKQIKDASLSYKWSCLVPMIKHKTAANTTSSQDGQQTALCVMDYYARKPIKVNQVVDFSGRFGKKQGTLSLALLTQLGASLRSKR